MYFWGLNTGEIHAKTKMVLRFQLKLIPSTYSLIDFERFGFLRGSFL
jgi:hypothetical protein